ncbi:MAG: copper amine oxidase [Acidimicrobiia bacterium]
MRRTLIGLLAGLALVGAACTPATETIETTAPPETPTTVEDTTTTPAETTTTAEAEAPSTETGAAELRATLTDLLTGHVYLAGIAVVQAVGQTGGFEAAAATLDQNSVDLSQAIGSAYGEEAAQTFLELWRVHIGFFVDYTNAAVAGDQAGQDQAVADLDGYRADFDAFLTGANPNLPPGSVAEALIPHVDSVLGAIDSVVAADGQAFDLLKEAAGHMPPTANTLAGAIAAQFPDLFDGNAESGASALRSGLTYLLDEHVYLAGIAVVQAVGQTGGFEAAAATLDQNSIDLSQAIGSAYGDEAGQTFLELWRVHIGFFVDYTNAAVAGDQGGQDQAVADLDGYRADFDAFLTGANPNLPPGSVSDALVPHVETVLATIDAVVAADGTAFDKLYVAGTGHMPMTANTLAGAIVAQFPEDFS